MNILIDIFGFLFLVLVPGFLTLRVFKIRNVDFWGALGLSVGFSILELILVALLGNTFLPLFGIAQPLGYAPLLAEVSLLVIVLFTFTLFSPKYKRPEKRAPIFESWHDVFFAFLPALFVVMSVLGAMRLNNGGNNDLTFSLLIGIGIYLSALIFVSCKKALGPNVIPIALFFIALSLLLMTSLRGWYITGHDIQREYRVMELTKNNGIWLIANFRDAYNACMSITVLPTIFAVLLPMKDPYVFKILFQVLFAVVPGLLYATLRNFAGRAVALLSTIYFIAFPTFFGDMAMLNRQEIAFLFLALMMYSIFNTRMALGVRQVLFIVFGMGMILSHYSTTYTVIALLLFLLAARPIASYFLSYFKNSAIENSKTPLVLVGMVGVLVAGTFLWSSVLTDTSSASITRVITKTIETMFYNTKEDTRSGDILYSLFSWKKLDKKEVLEDYKKTLAAPARGSAGPGTYYDRESYEKYNIHVLDERDMPLTKFGKTFASFGVNVGAFNYNFRQTSAKLLQALILIGLLSVLVTGRFNEKPFPREFVLLAAGSLLMILSVILLPVLSAEYGLLRAFQQSLLFLGIFIAIGSLSLFGKWSEKWAVVFGGALAIVFFFSATGVFTQALGGYPAQLHLNNDGSYYDMYYTHESEIQGINWLSDEVGKNGVEAYQAEVQTDRFEMNSINTIPQVDILKDIYPGLIRQDSYVYLGFTNVHKGESSLFWNGNIIHYSYPVQFLDENKDLVYSNGDVKIYR